METPNRKSILFESDPFLDGVASALDLETKGTQAPDAELPNRGGAESPLPEFTCLIDYLAYARQQKVSDLHISVTIKPFMRRFGGLEMIDVPPLLSDDTQRLLFEVLSEDQKQHLMKRGSLEFRMDVPGQGRYRCSIVKQRLGWDGIFHIIRNTIPTFEELNLPEVLKRLTEYQQGLVLVAGPANCGKTTTLAALLDMINANRSDHIITIERPIEYVHAPKQCHVTQREVGTNTDSFASALRSALRQDPDILMVGELTDLETLSMAIRASETGHLVFGTLHTTSAARTVNGILDAFPVAQQTQIRIMLSESLRGVISQHLIPRKDGAGVALAMEVLLVTSGVAALLRDNKALQIPSIIQTSRKMGMCLMDDSLMDLAKAGVIDGSVASRYAENKENFAGVKQTPHTNPGPSLRSVPSDTDKKRRGSLF